MPGKNRQNTADIVSELNAGRPVHYVASSDADAARLWREVIAQVTPEVAALLTITRAKDTP